MLSPILSIPYLTKAIMRHTPIGFAFVGTSFTGISGHSYKRQDKTKQKLRFH